MLFEIGFEKNGVCQARIIDGPSAEICTAYFAEIEPRATIYGAGPADGVKPGQPCTTVPADWTPAAETAAEPAAEMTAGEIEYYRDSYLTAPAAIVGAVRTSYAVLLPNGDILPADSVPEVEQLRRSWPGSLAYKLPAAGAAEPAPAAPAAPAPNFTPLLPGSRCYRIAYNGHHHDFITAENALLRYLDYTRDPDVFPDILRRDFSQRGTWIPINYKDLRQLVNAERYAAATAAACKNVSTVAAPVPDPDAPVPAHFSDGNMKLGKIANFSLAPMTSCSRQACETCGKDGCYALKSYHARQVVRTAWNDNTTLAIYSPECLETIIHVYLSKKRRKPIHFFRLHVGGDFITADYMRVWCRVAADFPQIHFLAFTKQFDIVRECLDDIPANLTIRLSDWPGTVVPDDLRQLFHVAWMNDGTRPDDTFPADALECPGNCETCGACWNIDRDTIFHKH